jgi:3-oxoadipate enol-lactonase
VHFLPGEARVEIAVVGGLRMHFADTGPRDAAPVVFLNPLGTDLRLWDRLLPLMPPGLRLVRMDTRGHGLTEAPAGAYAMGQLVGDAERLLDHLGVADAVMVGIDLGGLVAQGLAVKRHDLVRALVLSGTAARIGTAAQWQSSAEMVRARGLDAVADAVLEGWLPRRARGSADAALCRAMLLAQPAEGYAGCCAAIGGTDFYTTTAALTVPVLALAGSEDRATPSDLVRETTGLVRGARFRLLRGAGHLPCLDRPEAFAAALAEFLREVGHVGPAP